jgi:hypothetical protein
LGVIFALVFRPKGELTITLVPDAPLGSAPAALSAPAPATTTKPDRRAWPAVGMIAVVVIVAAILGAGGRSGSPLGALGAMQVRYTVTGTASGINITYRDGSGNIQQQNSLSVPLTAKSGGAGITFTINRGQFASIMAQNVGPTGTIDCAIEAGGQVINTGHASGGYAIASCSAILQ